MRRGVLGCALLLTGAVLALAIAVSATSADWRGRTFPGFLVMANRVVPSVALPRWPVKNMPELFQAEVLAVDGRHVRSSADVYGAVAARPAGSVVAYEFRRDGRVWKRSIPSMTFSASDAVFMFGAYIINGILFAFIGIGVWVLRPDLPAARAMLVLGLTVGTFALTGADLYGPHRFFRLHVAAEALFPAAGAYMALVFPKARPGTSRRWRMAVLWGPALALAATYEGVLFTQPYYSLVHNLCTLYAGLAGLIFVACMLDAYRRGSVLDRQKIRVVVLAALFGLGLPGGLLVLSGATGGQVAVNAVAFCGFLFPLGLGYSIVRHDLFEIDRVVRRLVYYLFLTALITAFYLTTVAVATEVVQTTGQAIPPLPLAFMAVLVFMPLRDRLQRLVDRVCFRASYDPRVMLEDASEALASTLDLAGIAAAVLERVDSALAIEVGVLYLRAPGGAFRPVGVRGSEAGTVASVSPEHPALGSLGRGSVVTWYAGRDPDVDPLMLGKLRSEILVPMNVRDELIAFLALGPRRAARYYSEGDVQFLRTLANQTALSILHAESYQELERLNLTLEHKVAWRTAELEKANGDLHESLRRLSEAYRELQQSQERLVHAEKMAALGRLAAQVAHEVSTPLGAARSSLRLAKDLADEYRDSIDDPAVSAVDHRDLAAELGEMVRRAERWTANAARFILTLKAHTRGYDWQPASAFEVLGAVREVEALLHDRLRAAGRVLRVRATRDIPLLRGDPTKLGQILVNLVTNSIDAYQDTSRPGDIDLVVGAEDGGVSLEVTDQAGGIPPEHRSRVFDELFTTKPAGRGTGLGLAIARDLVTNHFGGRIELDVVPGGGTTFRIRLPGASPGQSAAAGSG